MARLSFFEMATRVALPPTGESAVTSSSAVCRATLSLDGGNSFFDAFFDVSLAFHVTSADNTPNGNVYFVELK